MNITIYDVKVGTIYHNDMDGGWKVKTVIEVAHTMFLHESIKVLSRKG